MTSSQINYLAFALFSIMALFIAASNSAWAGNDGVRGWGDFTWGMTIEEVKKIDPGFEKEEGNEEYRHLHKKIELFNKDFNRTLSFKKREGLYEISIWRYSHDDEIHVYNKGLVFQALNTLTLKYGRGTSIQYDMTEKLITPEALGGGSTGESITIDHVWNLKYTTIKYTGTAQDAWYKGITMSIEPSHKLMITYSRGEAGKL